MSKIIAYRPILSVRNETNTNKMEMVQLREIGQWYGRR